MKKLAGIILKLLLVLAILGAGFFYRQQIENLVKFRSIYAPCERPITYSLGTFDSKFGISKEYFLKAAAEAKAIWEKPIDKELFTYTETGGQLTINLMYDYRQEATGKLSDLGIVVEENRASYDQLKAKYEALNVEYKKAKADYEAKVAAFNQKQNAYNQEVRAWNKKGGAPKQTYDELQARQAALNAEFAAIKKLEAIVNNYVIELNAMVVVLNQLAKTLNLNVVSYNTIGASRGEEFTEGDYQSSDGQQAINIYEFSSRDKLVRVLAHELGHALSLDHIEDPEAIMYRLNSGQNNELTADDLKVLKEHCAI